MTTSYPLAARAAHVMRRARPGSAFRLLLALLALLLAGRAARAQVLRGTYAAGNGYSLSIHADGTLWATGSNSSGQLGTGTTTSSTSWVQVGTATDWVQVAAGGYHSLGLRADGTLYAWGFNYYGQLGNATGNGTNTAYPTPTRVGTDTYTQVAAGQYHSLGLRADGSLYAWGFNYDGELGNTAGNGTSNAYPTPTRVGTDTYAQVAAGESHNLGLRADGTLYAWGLNRYGQLGNATGNNTSTAYPTPTRVGTDTYTQVAAGKSHSLGLRADGSLYAWGLNTYGQLGNATGNITVNAYPTPTRVGTDTYTQVAAGDSHSLGLRVDGSLYAWGFNSSGQLGNATGNGTSNAYPTPTRVGTDTYTQVAAGKSHSLGLRADGSLYAWGFNSSGQLGNGTTNSGATPTPTATGTALVTRSLAMGTNFGLAVRGDGTLWAWGDNQYGQLGQPTTTASIARPVQVGTATDWVMVAAGQYHSLGLRADGSLYAWGRNNYGQLGNATNSGTNTATPTPTRVGTATYTQVAAGQNHSLGLRADGSLYSWGYNNYGQLGNATGTGTFTAYPTPTRVGTATDWVMVAAGQLHSLGLRADGSLYAWGNNADGELGNATGNGTPNAYPTPTRVGTATDWVMVAAGQYHSLGLRADGSLYAWGQNYSGQLGNATGNGTPNAYPTPTRVGTDTYTQVAAGQFHSLGLRADGSLYAWGNNADGELGNGSTNTGATPTPTQEATAGTGWTTLGTGPVANSSLVRTASAQTFASAGLNSSGQLGDRTTTNASRFDRVSPLRSLQPLPVELTAFTATPTGPTAVRLAWATASEKNSRAFEVERSADGARFERISTVAASGTSSSARSYELLDGQLPTGTALRYYRLKLVDLDGSFAYSPVRTVALAGAAAGLSLYPNPTHSAATLTGVAPGAVVTVLDALGRPVLTATAAAAGTAALVLPAGLPTGVYVVRAGSRAVRLTVE